MANRLAFLGPEGTHTEQACISYDPEAVRLPFASIRSVAEAVASGQADEGMVPIENSLGGSVPDTLDLLISDSTLFIRNEVVLLIKHFLAVADGTKEGDIKVVYSHPQALTQCRSFLARSYPDAQLVASMSTSAAVKEMLDRTGDAAAIATERAAEIYGAKVLARGIEDSANNMTRFVVLAPSDHPPTGADKTSVCFSFDQDAPGILHDTLGEFASRGINLAKIESRPTGQSLGNYIFLVDLDGHREDTIVQEALSGLESRASNVKLFGSYPRSSMPQ
jgi:prephenate dehydratase